MSRQKKRLPFTVSRNDGRKFVVQVADGLRKAIIDGYYKPGDTLPASRELAPMLGVSRIVTTAALRRLADEGWTPIVGDDRLYLLSGLTIIFK